MPTPSGASRPGDAAPGKPSRARPPRWRFGASRGTPLSPRRRRRRRVGATITVLIIGSALGFGWLLLSHWQSSSNEAALSELRVQSQRLHHFDTLHMQLMAAESGVRGYFLSGDPMYLTALQESRFESELVLRGLAETGKDDSSLAELRDLLERRWRWLELAVSRDMPDLVAAVNDDEGSTSAQEAREALLAMRADTAEHIDAMLVESFERFSGTRQRNIGMGLAILAMLVLLLVMLYREESLRGRLADVLRDENDRLQRQVASRTAQLNALATYLTNVREQEKSRLARELHDELGSLLTAAKLDANWIARKLPPEALEPLRSRFDRLFDTLTQVIALKRKVVNDLRPPLLSDLGLMEALRTLASVGVGELEGKVTLKLPEELPNLPESVALALYRIAQEALTNVRRYASATAVVVELQLHDDGLQLEVTDNGVGFDPTQRRMDRHGLAGMEHRVQMLGGTWELDSAPGHGTRIRVFVPRSTWDTDASGVQPQ